MCLFNVVACALLAASPADAAVDLLPSPDGGFLTTWLVRGPTSPSVPDGEPGGRGWRRVTSETSMVDAGKKARPRGRAATWFGLVLVSDRAQEVLLKLGTDGRADVFLNGRQVSTHDREHYALWDDHLTPLKLTPGRHVLMVRTTRKKQQRNGGWKLVARIHDASNQVPAGLRVVLPGPHDAAAIRAEAARLKATRSLTPEGYALTVSLPVTGAAPGAPAVPWTATLSGQKTPLATGVVGGPAVDAVIAPGRDGQRTLTITAGGRTWTERILIDRGWNQALLEARKALAAARPDALGPGTVESITFNLDKLERHVLENIPDRRWLGEQIKLVSAWARAAGAGQDPFVTQRGDFYRAYRSKYDGNLQHYSVHVPPRYDRSERWPLVIGMHGIGSGTHYTLRRVLGKDRDLEAGEPGGKPLIRQNMPRLPDYGVITACPWGYHNSAYWFYGEDDVLRVIEEMKAAYRIDPDRIYLTGLSLGGLGTYHIGHHFPDRFAALGPLGGFSSIKLYQQLRNHPKRWWEKVLIEQRDATSYAENGLHTPMKVVHGKQDAPRHATAMTDRYKKLGYRHELDIPDLGHDVWQYSYGDGALIKWMKRFERPKAPDRIVFKTQSYRYVSAYWAKIGWIDDYTQPAYLTLHVDPRRRDHVIVDKAQNLRGFSLDLSQPKLDRGAVRIVMPGGVTLEAPQGERVHLRREGDGPWKLADSAAPPAGWKRPGVSGPLDDVMFEPHTFVVGTSDPAQTDVNRRVVREDRTYLRHRNHDIWFPMVDDTEVTEADLRTRNLVLYGNPKSNATLAKVLATGKVPLRFEKDALILNGQRFEGDDVGIKMIFPNPFNPDRVVVIVAGVTWRGTLFSRYLPRFLPDVIVYDARVKTRYVERILIDRPVLYGNFFGADWTLGPPRKDR